MAEAEAEMALLAVAVDMAVAEVAEVAPVRRAVHWVLAVQMLLVNQV